MNKDVHISYSFYAVNGASVSAALHDGGRLEGVWDWRRTVVRYTMRLLRLPLDVSAGVIKYGLRRKIAVLKPRRVFIHWIGHEMLRYEELGCLKDIPVTIVLHDFSLFEVPPYRKATWFDRWRLRRIAKVLPRLDVDYEAPSEWAAKHIKELCPDARVSIRRAPVRNAFCCKTIPQKEQAKERFKLLFGCQGGRLNPYKGFKDLVAALALLPQSYKQLIELHIFGEEAAECKTEGVRTVFHGVIEDPNMLASLYLNCDALAFPSLCETQGLVKDEALACGLKVIAFNRTACPEGIQHKKNGYIAEDVADFASGIMWVMDSSSKL